MCSLKAGSIKDEIISFPIVKLTANRFSDIDKTMKEIGKMITKLLFKESDFRSIGDSNEAAEITKLFTE